MEDERRQLRELRARVQARMEALARFDGVEWAPENMRELCCAMMSLGYGGEGGPMRIRATAEDTLLMEDYLAWVTAHFADEIALLDEVTTALLQRLHAEGLDENAQETAVQQACQEFAEGTEDSHQLPLFP